MKSYTLRIIIITHACALVMKYLFPLSVTTLNVNIFVSGLVNDKIANKMTDFQRTRSKVWFPNLDDDDDDILQHHNHHSWRRQPSSSPESRRVSSGSPSNGSHRSQDSGFSDSESSGSPSSGSSTKGVSVKEDCPMRPDEPTSAFLDELPDGILPEVARIPSPCSESLPLPEPCDCFLPACELSRKFASYDYDVINTSSEATTSLFKSIKRFFFIIFYFYNLNLKKFLVFIHVN